MRLDKFLVACAVGSRTEVKNLLKSGRVTVNGKKEKSAKLRGILTFLIECGVFWLYCLFLALNNFFIQKLPLYYRAKSLMSTCF